jgi:hypothetical protein
MSHPPTVSEPVNPPGLSISLSGSALRVPEDHHFQTPKHHQHADLIFVVAVSAKNTVSAAVQTAGRTAKIKLDLHKDGTAPLDSAILLKEQANLTAYNVAADKRFTMVTIPPCGGIEIMATRNFGLQQVVQDFELPLQSNGSIDGTFHIEIMAIDMHDADARQLVHKLFTHPDQRAFSATSISTWPTFTPSS